jgi:hypothetical protein
VPFVLYWGETWTLRLREEYRLRVLQNRVLRKIFGPKMDNVTGAPHKMLFWYFNKNEKGGACGNMGDGIGVYGKFEGNRRLGIPRCRWKENILIDL